MEIIAHLDLHEQFSIMQTADPLIYSLSLRDENQDIDQLNILH